MSAQFNAVRGTLTAGGTANVTISSAAAGKGQSPSVIPVGWTGGMRFDAPDGTTWELTKCTMLAGLIMSRDTVVAGSSGPGVKVNLPAGTIALQTALDEDLNGTPVATYLAANPVGTVAGSHLFLSDQGAASASQLATFALKQYPSNTTAAVRITTAGTIPLDFTSHNRRRIIVEIAGVTIAGPGSYGSVGDDFECEIKNISGAILTLGAGVICLPAGTTLVANGSAKVWSSAGKIYCDLPPPASASVAPGQVANVVVSNPTSSGLTVDYTAPTTGTTPFSYTVQYRATGGSAWLTAATGVSSTSYAIAGLNPATGYDIQVCAVNAGGQGAFSATATGTTAAGALPLPGQVTNLVAGTPTSGAVPLTWAAPSSGGAVASYTVQYRAGTTGTWLNFATGVTSTASSVSGLAAATAYQFQVLAVNATGPGTASASASATTAAAGGYTPGVAPFTVTARTSFPTAIGTQGPGDFLWHDIVATGSATVASVNGGLSTSNTIPPTSAIGTGTSPRGRWLGAITNYQGTQAGGWINNTAPLLNYSVTPATNFYYWMIITDSNGSVWTFCHATPISVLDGATKTISSGTSPTAQVQQ